MAEPLCVEQKETAAEKEQGATMRQIYKIVLLCGGESSEREVSLSGAANVEQTLISAGHKVTTIDTASPDFLVQIEEAEPEAAFLVLHGKGGEDGEIQAILEHLNIPYTGSGVLGSALAMDKYRTKIMYESQGLKTPESLYLKASYKDDIAGASEGILRKVGLPVVVKPADDGSSVGVAIVKKEEELEAALKNAFAAGSPVLAEQYITGVEITVPVVGSVELLSLPAIEIVPKNEFYDYESKYAEGGSVHIIPARIEEAVLAKANQAALLAHEILDCYGVSRTDMICDDKGDVWVIETNTIPGMTNTSLLPDSARSVGISALELYELLIRCALERAGRNG